MVSAAAGVRCGPGALVEWRLAPPLPTGAGARPSPGPDPVSPVVVDSTSPPGPVAMAPAGAGGHPTSTSRSPDEALPALRRELRTVLGSGLPEDREREVELLRSLVRQGDGRALDEAIAAVEDPRCTLFEDAAQCEDLFGALRDRAAVQRFALRAIESNLAGNHAELRHLSGFHTLVARNGGTAGGRTLLEHLSASPAGLRRSAAFAVAHLQDRSLAGSFLALVIDEGSLDLVGPLATSLVAWDEDGITAVLHAAAFDPALAAERRAELLVALGRRLDRDQLRAYLDLYRTTAEPDLRAAVLEGLARLRPQVPPDTGPEETGALQGFVIELLGDPDPAVVTAAVKIVESVPTLGGTTLRTVLISVRGTHTPPELATRLEQAARLLEQR